MSMDVTVALCRVELSFSIPLHKGLPEGTYFNTPSLSKVTTDENIRMNVPAFDGSRRRQRLLPFEKGSAASTCW